LESQPVKTLSLHAGASDLHIVPLSRNPVRKYAIPFMNDSTKVAANTVIESGRVGSIVAFYASEDETARSMGVHDTEWMVSRLG